MPMSTPPLKLFGPVLYLEAPKHADCCFPEVYCDTSVIQKPVQASSLSRVSIVTAQANKQNTCGSNWLLFLDIKVTEFRFHEDDR